MLWATQEGIASKGKFRSIRGCRVRRLEKHDGSGPHVWNLYGNPGNQAHHEAKELDVEAADDQYLGHLPWDEWNGRLYIYTTNQCQGSSRALGTEP